MYDIYLLCMGYTIGDNARNTHAYAEDVFPNAVDSAPRLR